MIVFCFVKILVFIYMHIKIRLTVNGFLFLIAHFS